MAVGFSNTNKPLNPRGQDASPKGYNRAALYSGKALDFDGVNDKVAIHDATDLWTGDFSVSWYGNLDATGNQFAFSSGIYHGGVQAGINFWYGGASNTNFSAHFPESDGTGQQGYNLTLAESYEYWHRIDLVFVSSSRLLSLYQNGILVDTATVASNVDAAYMPNGWEFGNSYGGAYPLNGKLTNLKAFNVALTAAQVADLYNNPEKVVPTGVDNTALKLWLPMMEGAGTTAYDGSGNGNHGTIAGATYVNGIGAPVAQSAVMDWNKGTNLFEKSEQFGVSPWSSARVTITNGIETAPDGRVTASRALETSVNGYRDAFISNDTFAAGVPITLSCFVKGGLGRDAIYLYTNNGSGMGRAAKFNINTGAYIGDASGSGFSAWDSYESEDFGNGWFRFSATINSNTNTTSRVYNLGISDNTNDALAAYDGDVTKGIYFWGASLEQSATAGPYVRTGATAQTSPVLLPQGLTTGRDITGVNLFENVRKQGALNLDGNSWAEVHDNASLDITDAITLEAWVYAEADSLNKGILGKWDFSGSKMSYLLIRSGDGSLRFYTSATGGIIEFATSTTTITNGNWYHLVGTDDGTNLSLYLNGSLEDTSTSFGSIYESEKDVEIGRHGYGAIGEISADIAQPRIYNRALTAAEVLQNYNSGKNTYK